VTTKHNLKTKEKNMIFNTKEKTIGEIFRFDGAEEIKISEPVLLEVVRAEKDCDCEKCYFAAIFRKICQEALYGFSCKASERSDGNPVYYKFVCLDIEEQMAYTKRCYLEWLKRRNRLPEFFVKALDAVRRGENEFVAEMGRHERTIGIPNET